MFKGAAPAKAKDEKTESSARNAKEKKRITSAPRKR
jgi:hypothetical protein